jgi:hypothetical protein
MKTWLASKVSICKKILWSFKMPLIYVIQRKNLPCKAKFLTTHKLGLWQKKLVNCLLQWSSNACWTNPYGIGYIYNIIIVITIIMCCMIEKQHFCNDYSYGSLWFNILWYLCWCFHELNWVFMIEFFNCLTIY